MQRKRPDDLRVIDFIRQHQKDAAKIASEVNVPTANILGLSGHETGWGTNRASTEDNNYFSIHGKGTDGSSGVLASYHTEDGYLESGQAFVDNFGDSVKGISDPREFADNLTGPPGSGAFNPASKKSGGDPGFIDKVANAIDSVNTRINCPQLAGR